MLGFPVSTEFNKRIPKQKFYENLDVSPALHRIFVDQIKLVYWRNKLAASTLNIAAGEAVTEIEVFEVRLNDPQLDEAVLKQIDKEIPYHILFILTCDGKAQAWIGYKEAAASGSNAFKVSRYYHTDWMTGDELHLSIDGLNMDGKTTFVAPNGELFGSSKEAPWAVKKGTHEINKTDCVIRYEIMNAGGNTATRLHFTLDGYPLFPDFALAKDQVKKIIFVLPLREGEKQSQYVLKFVYGDVVSSMTYSQIETLNIMQDEHGVTFSQSMADLLTAPKKENENGQDQAKAFYNAYIALDQLCRDDSDTLLLLFAPLVVNGAFSVELALKAILAKNQIEYGKEHNLLILFQMLPKSFQQELWAYLIEKAPEYAGSEKGLDELILLSNAFVDWRYAFEGKPVPAIESRFLAAFANAAVHTMFSYYNADLLPATKTESNNEIEQRFHENREKCKEINLKMIQKKTKEHQL